MREQNENEHSENQEQIDILTAFTGTIENYFGSWKTIFDGVRDARNPKWITYPLEGLLCAGLIEVSPRTAQKKKKKKKKITIN